MSRTNQRRTKTPTFRFDLPNISDADWIGMSEGHRLPTKPSRQTLYTWTRVGAVLPWLPDGFRLKLPTFVRNGKRFTTRAAYDWWMEQQNRQ